MTVHVLSDPTSKAGLLEIFSGSQVVFANTNTLDKRYDGKPGSPTEFQALQAIVDAAIEAKVELLVLSCLPDAGELGDKSPDFFNKVKGMKYAKQKADETGLKVVYVQLGWYITNFIDGHDPVVHEVDGVVEFAMQGLKQDKRVPWVSTYTDLGPIVKALIDNPEPYIGKEIPIVAELLTMEEIARIYESITGQPSRATSPPLPTQTPHAAHWAGLMGILNSEAYMVDEGIMQLAMELMKKEKPEEGMTGWGKWLQDTKFDAKKKKEGYGEVISTTRQKWGGRKFV